jgi:hypothetical protein
MELSYSMSHQQTVTFNILQDFREGNTIVTLRQAPSRASTNMLCAVAISHQRDFGAVMLRDLSFFFYSYHCCTYNTDI